MSGIIGVSPNMKSGVVGMSPKDMCFKTSYLPITSGSAENEDESAWTTAFTQAFTPERHTRFFIITLYFGYQIYGSGSTSAGSDWQLDHNSVELDDINDQHDNTNYSSTFHRTYPGAILSGTRTPTDDSCSVATARDLRLIFQRKDGDSRIRWDVAYGTTAFVIQEFS